MSKKTDKKSTPATEASRKKPNILPFLAVAAVAICAAVVLLTPKNDASTGNSNPGRANSGVAAIAPGEALVIPTAAITADASFHPIKVDGTVMEVIAVRDSAGAVRTAFNTCQVCYDSGKGYYVQSGRDLVCQNCGNRFSMDQVGIEAGGCNPWPIFTENTAVTADAIAISHDFLVKARDIFAHWKGNSQHP